jgi:ribosomal protein L15
MKVTNPLTPEAICNIIEACSHASVSEFIYGGLTIRFGNLQTANHDSLPQDISSQVSTANAETLLDGEVNLREEQLSAMVIENPVEYEKLLLDGDLSDAELNDSPTE